MANCTLFILGGFPVRESNPGPWSQAPNRQQYIIFLSIERNGTFHFKWLYLSVGLIEAKIWHFKISAKSFCHFFFNCSFFSAHRSIRHPRNQLTVALCFSISFSFRYFFPYVSFFSENITPTLSPPKKDLKSTYTVVSCQRSRSTLRMFG